MRIRFAAAKPERGRDMKRKQVAPVWLEPPQRPAIAFQRLEDSEVLGKTIAMRGVEQENITVGSETAITEKVSRVSQREERFADAEGRIICTGDLRVGLKIERITHVLKPSESVRRQRLRRADRRFRAVEVHGVYHEMVPAFVIRSFFLQSSNCSDDIDESGCVRRSNRLRQPSRPAFAHRAGSSRAL